jgi:hypothetical protein
MPRHWSSFILVAWLAFAGSPLLAASSPRNASPRASVSPPAIAVPGRLAWAWQHLTRLWASIGCTADPDGVKCASGTIERRPAAAVTATTPAGIGCGSGLEGVD